MNNKENKPQKNMTTSKSLGRFAASSTLSAIVDVVLYAFLYHNAFLSLTPALHTFWAVVISRVTSSIINYAFNSKFVFKVTNSATVSKYYLLWFMQLCLSYYCAYITANVFLLNPTISKAFCDLMLGLISFNIQKKWVFVGSEKSSGPLVSVVRSIAKIFYPKYKTLSPEENSPCVYVCHHMNMHGPLVTLIWLKSHPHPMILDCFFNYGTCYKHYKDFTFTMRFKKARHFSKLLSLIATVITVPLVRSLHAIPVHRGGNNSFVTMKTSMKVLAKGHNIIVFPDKDYANRQGSDSNIYDGFLLLESLYYRKTGHHLAFVPLVVDDNHKRILQKDPIYFESQDFYSEQQLVADKIRYAITN
ncbi:MAG: GtrA family protein [Clostridia bacterium]|nr:GtrA family protein [Clostridia bacterium]